MNLAQQSLLNTIALACNADQNKRLEDQYRKHVYPEDLMALYVLCLENSIDQILTHQDNPSVVAAYADAMELMGRDTYYKEVT